MFVFFNLKEKCIYFSYRSPYPFPNYPFLSVPPRSCVVSLPCPLASVPAKGDVSWSVPSLLHQRLVELAAGPRVDGCPAILTVVLQTGHVGAEERSKLPPTAGALALITQLVVQDIWLHFHLRTRDEMDDRKTVKMEVEEKLQRTHSSLPDR